MTSEPSPNELVPLNRRRPCLDCRLIEPEPGTWIEGRCPRCAPRQPVNPTAAKRRAGRSHPRPDLKGQPAKNRIDITGQQFGRLTVIGYSHTNARRRSFWNCRCACGKDCTVHGGHLRRGQIVSCGCYRRERERAFGLLGRKIQRIRRREALHTGVPVKLSEDFSRAKLTSDQARAIRLEYASGGMTCRTLAAKFGISHSAVEALLRGQSWRDAGGPIAPSGKSKLTADIVRTIRQEYAAGGVSYQQLGEKYGVTRGAVMFAVQRRNWRHVE